MTEITGDAPTTTATAIPAQIPLRRGLSGKLLLLTLAFLLLGMTAVYVSFVAHAHRSHIVERYRLGVIAAEALWGRDDAGAPLDPRSADLRQKMLNRLNAYVLSVKDNGRHYVLAGVDQPPVVERSVAPLDWGYYEYFAEALDTLLIGSNRAIAISGPWRSGGTLTVEVPEQSLRASLIGFTGEFARSALLVAVFTGIGLFWSLRHLFVRPILKLASAVDLFERQPDDPGRILVARPGHDEIGHVERSIAAMQTSLQDTLRQQRRLADVGLGVAKINHDLRNLLSSAQLVSDRLVTVPDPTVQRFAPKLISALDRAIAYCEAVLAYGKASEPAPKRRLLRLASIVSDAAEVSGAAVQPNITFEMAIRENEEIDADPDQLFRILVNLLRNSVQALDASPELSLVRRITVSAERLGSVMRLRIADTGPGVPERLRDEIFRPFHGSMRRGGSGLGLAIAAELVKAHSGTIALLDEAPGTTFEIEIPDQPIQLFEPKHRRAG